MKKLIDKKYRDYIIYTYDEKLLDIGKKIIDKNYEVLEIYKDTKRNYVGKILVDKENYILKSPKSEVIIPQRNIMTRFKRGEALNTLINITQGREEGILEYVKPLIAIVKRKGTIRESYLVSEYISGEILKSTEDIDKVINIVKKIHKINRYHGDLNTSNFIKKNGKLFIIDTQGKKDNFLRLKKYYDILTLKKDLLVRGLNYSVDEKYKYNKFSLGYLIAYFLKEFKSFYIIEKFRGLKSKLREKGWKI